VLRPYTIVASSLIDRELDYFLCLWSQAYLPINGGFPSADNEFGRSSNGCQLDA